MTELSKIISSYRQANSEGKQAALATVVKVEGSSYRQPGARMLVNEDGILTGAISGGCLEGDALRKALLAIHQKQNKLVTYDTSDEDAVEIGVQLGCNGIVHILFEYIDPENSENPVALLQKVENSRDDHVIVTVFSLKRNAVQVGTSAVYNSDENTGNIQKGLINKVRQAFLDKLSLITNLETEGEEQTVLIEYIPPPLSLIIVGAGNDVQPLSKMADLLGWEVTVAEGRVTHATQKRFPEAKKILIIKSEEFINHIVVDSRTCVVLMTHNYTYDFEVLKQMVTQNCRYIGVLGPKKKLNRMLDDLKNAGRLLTDEQLNKIYGPVGLDIGAETSEEIALSVVAEIKAIMENRDGSSLRDKKEKIHRSIFTIYN
ncbi:XdhC family protein [Chryseobacterium sp. SSA4.19]|uniref:XdhC family protein n=1 Tax=Chryseobacterium sp. SSA4.19 TaxID=2919915 RepID=UPI001F4D454A|nr:XdhC/CoxI family protein [Chryseobacterium sp. SSA4.19]MCJ8152735.1 XdhC family protein [Chryseobacterium sp. SSA4.19]